MKTYEVKSLPKCPTCAEMLECASAPFKDSGKPEAGDLTVCIKCGTASRFTDELQLHKMTPEEERELHPDTKRELKRLLNAFWKMKGPRA